MHNEVLLELKNVRTHFPIKNSLGIEKASVKAVDGVTLNVKKGETYGLVGESGCGKSTLGRTIIKLVDSNEGEIIYNGNNLLELSDKEFKSYRNKIQMIFQDPYSSLNPRKRIGESLEEPLIINKIGTKKERTNTVFEMLEKVGLNHAAYFKYPHEFSGGQRQRIGIARALVLQPDIIICDEPVSALDVSIQSQVINLMKDIQEEFGVTYIFIAHDLSVVKYISDRVGVMYLGKIVEEADVETLYNSPKHPYTKMLLSVIPEVDTEVGLPSLEIKGEIPSPINPPQGCNFRTRCPFVMDKCKTIDPETYKDGNSKVACYLFEKN